jgi:hypothetical protein
MKKRVSIDRINLFIGLDTICGGWKLHFSTFPKLKVQIWFPSFFFFRDPIKREFTE